MRDPGRHQQAAVLQVFLDHLIDDQLAALEVTGHFLGNLQHDFLLFLAQPDAILLLQAGFDARVGLEHGVGQAQPA